MFSQTILKKIGPAGNSKYWKCIRHCDMLGGLEILMFDSSFCKQYQNRCFVCEHETPWIARDVPIEYYKLFDGKNYEHFTDNTIKRLPLDEECFADISGNIQFTGKDQFCINCKINCDLRPETVVFYSGRHAFFIKICSSCSPEYLGSEFLFGEE